MLRIVLILTICAFLAGCESMPLKNGELYLNKNTSVTMDDLGVAKMKGHF